MIFINELDNLKLYKKQFYLPRDEKNKKTGEAVMILSPDMDSSISIINHNLILKPYYNSYYIEKNMSLFINENTSICEGASNFKEDNYIIQESVITEKYSKYVNNKYITFSGDKYSISNLSDTVLYYLDKFCKEFNVRINSKISITFLDDYTDSDINTRQKLFLPSYNSVDNLDEIMKESIINFILNYKYDVNDNIIDGISIVYSGLFDIIKDDMDTNGNEYIICICIERLKSNDNHNNDINHLLKTNDIEFLLKYMPLNLTESKTKEKDTHLKYVKNLFSNIKRKITTKNRKNGDNKLSKVKKDIENTRNINPIKKENVIDENYIISLNEALLEEDFVQIGNTITYFDEATASNIKLRNILYKERIRNSKDVVLLYDELKKKCPEIKYTHININRYNKLNLFVDLYFYNQLFFKNSSIKGIKGAELYFDLMSREINNKNLISAGYNRMVIVPVYDWVEENDNRPWLIKNNITPISIIYDLMQKNIDKLKSYFGDMDFVFLGIKTYFKINFNKCTSDDASKFLLLIKKVIANEIPKDDGDKKESNKSIKTAIIDDIEDNLKITITKGFTGDADSETDSNIKSDIEAINDKIDDVASKSNTKEDALKSLDDDEEFKLMILNLSTEKVNNRGPEMTKSRIDRNTKLQSEVLYKKVKDKSISEILEEFKTNEDKLENVNLDVKCLDDSWSELTFPSQAKQYDPDADILKILMHLANTTYPVNIIDINIEDTSTSEDYIYTYTVALESYDGRRFSIKFDIPKIKDNQYFLLRGNKKTINAQTFLLPISKTGPSTVQIVSNYSKIFIELFGSGNGKTFMNTDRLIKTINKYNGKDIKITYGNCSGTFIHYNLPIDYMDLGNIYKNIEFGNIIFYFNQDIIREEYGKYIDDTKGLPIGVIKSNKINIVYSNTSVTNDILSYLFENEEFKDIYDNTSISTKYIYSKASILNCKIPLIILISYYIGICETLDRAKIKYEFIEKRPNRKNDSYGNYDYIKFSDGYLQYDYSLESSLLLNGLKECDTANYSIKDINSKFIYLDFLEQFGGKLKSDGLDNFYDLMIDPITKDILNHYNLPDNYIDLLLYANSLLVNNNYTQQADVTSGKRIRRNELIAGYAYKAISNSYGSFAIQAKHGREVPMTIKQSAVIDLFLQDPTAGDLSIINPLGEFEAYAAISPKGLSGMNTDRAYKLEERLYHESMKGIYSMSTGFAGTVGVNRELTINASINGVRGYINTLDSAKDLNTANTLSMTEAVTPFSSTRDDPFRLAMTYIQTSKHSLRVTKSDPSLVSNGSEQVLPYLVSNIFCTKAPFDGKITEITDTYMILTENTKNNKKPRSIYVDLSEKVEKNSSSGFYVVIKQDTDLKVGKSVKEGDILAYDKSCFSNMAGASNNISYNTGTLAKCAILDTDEGFEDSAIISQNLAKALGTEVVVEKAIDLSKNTNVYNVLPKGSSILEGDTLMVIQNSYDEEDANILLKNLADDEDVISELGRVPIKSKINGIIQDIKIYRTVELDELSDSLKDLCKKYESNIKKTKKIFKDNNIEQYEELDPDYTLSATGKLKNIDGVRIVFYLKYIDIMAVGDKMIYNNALKGVTKSLFPEGDEPYSEFRNDERIDSLLPLDSINGRMVTSVLNVGAINKLMVELSRQIKDKAGIKYNISLTDLDN